MTNHDKELREQIRRAQSDLVGRRATHLQVARKSGWTPRELDGVHEGDQIIFENEILALITTDRERAVREARIDGMSQARSRVLRRTEIPKDAKEPTRDYVVILGEEIADIITRDIATLSTQEGEKL